MWGATVDSTGECVCNWLRLYDDGVVLRASRYYQPHYPPPDDDAVYMFCLHWGCFRV